MRLLDVGAGIGTLAMNALERWPQAEVIASDAAAGMLEYAKQRVAQRGIDPGGRLSFAVGPAEELPLDSGIGGRGRVVVRAAAGAGSPSGAGRDSPRPPAEWPVRVRDLARPRFPRAIQGGRRVRRSGLRPGGRGARGIGRGDRRRRPVSGGRRGGAAPGRLRARRLRARRRSSTSGPWSRISTTS